MKAIVPFFIHGQMSEQQRVIWQRFKNWINNEHSPRWHRIYAAEAAMSVQMSSGIISLDDPELTNFSVDCVQKYYLLERLLIFSYIFFRIKFPREACADLLTYFTKIIVLASPGMNYDLPETCEQSTLLTHKLNSTMICFFFLGFALFHWSEDSAIVYRAIEQARCTLKCMIHILAKRHSPFQITSWDQCDWTYVI